MRRDIFEASENNEKNDLEDIVFRLSLTYSRTEKEIDIEFIDSDLQVCELPPGVYEIMDVYIILSSRISVTIDDIIVTRIFRNEPISTVLRFSQKFFHSVLGFFKLAYNSGICSKKELMNISGIEKIHLNFDCIAGRILKGARQTIIYIS